jgi:hypothetical protein
MIITSSSGQEHNSSSGGGPLWERLRGGELVDYYADGEWLAGWLHACVRAGVRVCLNCARARGVSRYHIVVAEIDAESYLLATAPGVFVGTTILIFVIFAFGAKAVPLWLTLTLLLPICAIYGASFSTASDRGVGRGTRVCVCACVRACARARIVRELTNELTNESTNQRP